MVAQEAGVEEVGEAEWEGEEEEGMKERTGLEVEVGLGEEGVSLVRRREGKARGSSVSHAAIAIGGRRARIRMKMCDRTSRLPLADNEKLRRKGHISGSRTEGLK
jgi:hypothetical protein